MEWLDEEQRYWDEQRAYYGEVVYESVAKLIAAVRVAEKALYKVAKTAQQSEYVGYTVSSQSIFDTREALAQLQSGEFGEGEE